VPWTFGGGSVKVLADYNGLVNEYDQANNNFVYGTIGVMPKDPTNVRVCSLPCDLFGYKDNSAIETGYGIKIQRRTSCSSGTWTTVSQFLHPPKNGTDDVYAYDFTSGYCWRVRVTALGPIVHSNEKTSSGVFFP
jgi:hypothetical protein